MKSRRGAAAGLALGLLSGCSVPAVLPGTSSPGVGSASPAPSATKTRPAATNATARFGTTHRWPDGLAIKVTKPAPFWPSGWVREVNNYTHFVVVSVTIKNGTGAPIDLTDLDVQGRSASKDADTVHDPGKVGPAPPAKIARGTTASFRIAMGVQKPSHVQVRVTLGATRPAVLFTT